MTTTTTLEDFGHYFLEHERLMAHWRAVLPIPIHEVCYEALIAEPETTCRALVDHCELDWDPACLDFHKTERTIQTPSPLAGAPTLVSDLHRAMAQLPSAHCPLGSAPGSKRLHLHVGHSRAEDDGFVSPFEAARSKVGHASRSLIRPIFYRRRAAFRQHLAL